LFDRARKELEAMIVVASAHAPAEGFAAPLPDQSLERVLRIDTQKPRDGEDEIDHQGHGGDGEDKRQEWRAQHPGPHRQTGEHQY
jgi:hypothetical protein